MSTGIERPKGAAARVGVGLTVFGERYVDHGGDPDVPGTDGKVKRVRPVPLGERAIGFFSDELDRLLEELRAWRDASPRMSPKRAVALEYHPSRHRRSGVSARKGRDRSVRRARACNAKKPARSEKHQQALATT